MAHTFRTQGAGAQQTLHEIEDEKIPVYDTTVDAEADLANLAEGQIVGTKDAGGDEQTLIEYVDGRLETTEVNVSISISGLTCKARKSGNTVTVVFIPAGSDTIIPHSATTTIGTLPEGYRPVRIEEFTIGSRVVSSSDDVATYPPRVTFTPEGNINVRDWNPSADVTMNSPYNTFTFLVDGTNSHGMTVNTLKDAKDYTDAKAVIRHDYTITGTNDTIADTQALVNHILTLGKGTYAGEFKRQGVTFSNYELTYFIDGDGTKSVLGLVTYGVSQSSGDQTYQISYILPTGSSTPTWAIRPVSNVFSSEYFSGVTMDQIWDQAQQNKTLRIGCLPYNDSRNPTLAEYQSYEIPAQNVEVHAGYYTVTAYSFDGRVFTYDKTSGWVNTTARDIQKYDIVVPNPGGSVMNMFEALRYHLLNANWNYLIAKSGRVCTGKFELSGYYFGQYTASHHGNSYMTITGTIDTGGLTHTFSAFYEPSTVQWKFTIDGQSFISIDGGFVFTRRQNDNMYVYNVTGSGTYQAFITAMANNGLLGRPSRGEALIIPNIAITVNNKYLLTLDPPYTSTWPASTGWWLQNPEFYNINTATSELWIEWINTATVSNANLWGINWAVTTIQTNLEIIV